MISPEYFGARQIELEVGEVWQKISAETGGPENVDC
jgi:hypothetical protein